MTYPPQPGQGGDPYGQGWQQPGSGGVPQQPGWDPNAQQQPAWDPNAQQQPGWDPNAQQQQPAWDPNAQQQYPGGPYPQQPYQGTQQFPQQGWDQSQYPGGPGGEPPKGNKTGLWIGIAVAVVLVAALGITGFVAPGFFLSKDKSDNQAQNQSQAPVPSQQAPASSSAQLPSDDPSEPTDSGTPGSGGADTAQVKQLADNFIGKLNAKDSAGASAMLCASAKSSGSAQKNIDEAVSSDPQLTIKQLNANPYLSTATLGGSMSGKTANGLMLLDPNNGNLCISSFTVFAF
ncbi:hypothetical protein [Amycolatopsis benzoatilytica]|uniref:hypothetical protein n=1 Tax=Amycolatopsis benzoatilytica TaxID=346045 RepID=UPI00036D608C|nr:hypothetical protein [Amycolatopsis benzoatilytica]